MTMISAKLNKNKSINMYGNGYYIFSFYVDNLMPFTMY